MFELKRIDTWSLAKIYAVTGLIVGFIIGLIITIASLVMGSMMSAAAGATIPAIGALPFAMIGVFSIIVMPISYAIGGLISGVIAALLYNFVAGRVGGVLVDLEKPGTAVPKPAKK